MPKSKRNKIVSLTRTKKRGRERKVDLVQNVRSCANEFKSIYVFKVSHMRNTHLQEVRREWKDSRFFFGKNKVMSVALGRDDETELFEGIASLSNRIKGICGLLFTNEEPSDVEDYFSKYTAKDYLRSGNTAPITIALKAGPLKGFAHSMEPRLRQLGMPTKLNFGVVELERDYTICNEGDVLSPEQCRILKLFDHKLATFHFTLLCRYDRESTSYHEYVASGDSDDEDEADEEDDE